MNDTLKVCWLTCTKGRHTMLERNVRMFLDQDYPNKIMIIYNNSHVPLFLDDELKEEGNITLINNYIDTKTNEPYKTLGAIYNDCIRFIPEDVDLLVGADDDDIFLPNHISEGVKGYIEGKLLINPECKAYKPMYSYFVYLNQPIARVANVMEPSIFVDMNHIRKHGYHDNTENQHHKWLSALGTDIYVKEDGISTFCVDWSQSYGPGVFKASGNSSNPENFLNYSNSSQDHGDMIVTAIDSCEKWYKMVRNE